MPEYLQHFGMEIPFILILMALLGYRARVTPTVQVQVKASPATVFGLVDLHDGKVQNWSRTRVHCHLVDPSRELYRMTYVTTLTTGATQTTQALFRVHERRAPTYLEIHREGLEGRSENNELLKIAVETTREGSGTRLRQTYHWGPRPLLAQILARADLWGGAYRLKGLAETGTPDELTHSLISAGVAGVTALLSLVAFSIMAGWLISGLLVLALFIHEVGHLVAYRMMGQPWGRLVFLPFLGALAMPRLPFDTQGQAVFAALMGPAFSVVVAGGMCLIMALEWFPHPWFIMLGMVICGLNLFNLLPVEPLDGGVALRSVLAKLMGAHARFGLMLVGALIVVAGINFGMLLMVIFGGLSILANLRPRQIDTGLRPLNSLQVTASACAYGFILASYLILLRFFLDYLLRP
jgi:Zn-dependent protease